MERRTILLSVAFFVTLGLTGCQTIKENQKSMLSNSKIKTNLKTPYQLFQVMPDDSLKEMESRIVFFRNAKNNDPLSNINPSNINISMGPNKVFQVSLTNGHYSDLRV
ncbi:hypothetical protein [Psychrobacter fozii]|uniref:Uncharacterized protein n=1 Tax=Psychrobacter fozii TaxID=198480 RepID=A0A2V4UCP5_9GAMM|nr:hypothetical protein [Psychrobacter fozii]PYE36419.1 hypothetical protein DFP82_1186 [Psychrobacter fozii]